LLEYRREYHGNIKQFCQREDIFCYLWICVLLLLDIRITNKKLLQIKSCLIRRLERRHSNIADMAIDHVTIGVKIQSKISWSKDFRIFLVILHAAAKYPRESDVHIGSLPPSLSLSLSPLSLSLRLSKFSGYDV